MNESAPGGFSSGPTVAADAPTPEQAAILQYLGLAPAEGMTQAQAGALIVQSEADPDGREKLQAWHRDKYRLHPELFAPPQRSFREARWWQARISDDNLYGYSFRQPSLSQTLVILEALDRREPGWDREAAKRRETRFMTELATLSPELCKPGCAFPHDLPENDATEPTPAAPAFRAPSAPFVPDQYATTAAATQGPGKPAWNPPVQPPTQFQKSNDTAQKSDGGWKWAGLAAVALAGVGAYFYFGFHPPVPERADSTGSSTAALPSPDASAPVAAKESRQRAVAKYPDLAKAGTPLNTKFVAAFRQLESEHNPLLQQPDWPERLAAQCAGVSPPSVSPPSPTAAPKAVVSSPSPSASKPAAATPSPKPAAHGTAPPVPVQQTAVPSPPVPAAALAAIPAATPSPSPAGMPFVTLDAVNKSRMNNYTYHWSPYYYADYDVSFRQTVGIEVKVRNMAQKPATVNLRWMFFGRKTNNSERYVFSASQKRLELAPGQTTADVLDSPMLQSTAAVSYSYGMHYYAGSKYEGWLVQILPEGNDQIIRQVGSTGYIEDYGKRSDLTALLKEQLKK